MSRALRTLCVMALLAGCTDLPSGATTPFSLTFDPLPSPAVVVGDTLRDSTGAVAALAAHAYNSKGAVIPAAPIRFHSLDSTVAVDSTTGLVTSVRGMGTARLYATAGGLQSPTQLLTITLRPDTIVAKDTALTLAYSLLGSAPYSDPLRIQLFHGTTMQPDSTVVAYLVSFRIVYPADTAAAALVTAAHDRSSVDTTDASGIAGRMIAVHPAKLANPNDSVVVEARARYRSGLVHGSPVRLILRLQATTH